MLTIYTANYPGMTTWRCACGGAMHLRRLNTVHWWNDLECDCCHQWLRITERARDHARAQGVEPIRHTMVSINGGKEWFAVESVQLDGVMF